MNTVRAISKISLIRFKHNVVIKISGCLIGKLVPPPSRKAWICPLMVFGSRVVPLQHNYCKRCNRNLNRMHSTKYKTHPITTNTI